MANEPVGGPDEARRGGGEVEWADPQTAREAGQDDELAAERDLAAARGEQYAQVIDIGFQWSTGATLPHLLANGSRAFIVCYAIDPDSSGDGTRPKSVSPNDEQVYLFGVIELWDCASVRLGLPDEENLTGHPLYGHGLEFYGAHEVHNSQWLEELRRINSVRYRHHHEQLWRSLHHYLLAFHDEMFEAIAGGIHADVVRTTLRPLLGQLIDDLIDPART